MTGVRCITLVASGLLAVSVMGCEPQTETERAQKDPLVKALYEVGLMYHTYHDVNAVGPANWEELSSMAGGDQAKLDAIQTVKDKGYNLKWGKKFSELTGGASNTVLGESPQGGPKLMFDGSISLEG